MPTFNSDLLPDQSGRNLGNGSQTWNLTSGTVSAASTITSSSTITGTQLISTIGNGTAPLAVSSSTKVPNLNADLLDGSDWGSPGAIGSTSPSTGAFTTLTATSLSLNGGATLVGSGQTGSGNFVLANSPSITTPTLTNPTVTSGSFSTPSLTNPVISGTTGVGSLATLTLNPVTGQAITVGGALNVNTTPVTVNANLTSAQNLMNFAAPAKMLNSVGRTLRIFGAGIYTTQSAQTPTITIQVNLGARTLATWTSDATTASQTNLPWSFEIEASVVAVGGSGTLEVHGNMRMRVGSGAGSSTSYPDSVTAVSGTIDLTSAQLLQIQGTFSTNAATANILTQRLLTVGVSN